jgi:asparagine synthase (glutamine-hydrolysing)
MRSRYLAIILDTPDEDDRRGASLAADLGLSPIMSHDRCKLFGSGSGSTVTAASGSGYVLGTLFDHGPSWTKRSNLTSAEQSAIVDTGGRWLVDNLWGAYVAFFYDPGSGVTLVVRDPSAALPCYFLRIEGATLVASDVAILRGAGFCNPKVDWTYVAGHLMVPDVRPSRTGFVGLLEVLGGERLAVRQGRSSIECLWSPWTFAERGREIRDPREASARVRDVTLGCVAAWASCFEHCLLGISGGLDSSIVAASLAYSRARFSCLTIATADRAGDERRPSRIVAESLDTTLHERFESLAFIDVTISHAAHLPRPVARIFAQSGDRHFSELAARYGVDAFMTGGGGDNVFAYLPSVVPIADRLLSEGPGSGVWTTAKDICWLTQCSMFTALSRGIRRAWLRPPTYVWPRQSLFLSQNAIERAAELDHPWMTAPRGALPGKAMHIAWLLGIQNFLEGFRRELDHPIVTPLMSQPLVELCLQIPTWLWCADGRNRAVARDAFSDLLPPAILARRSKGTPSSFSLEIFETHRASIEAMLLDGHLARQGLIDIGPLSHLLRHPHPAQIAEPLRALRLLDVEAWLRSPAIAGPP